MRAETRIILRAIRPALLIAAQMVMVDIECGVVMFRAPRLAAFAAALSMSFGYLGLVAAVVAIGMLRTPEVLERWRLARRERITGYPPPRF